MAGDGVRCPTPGCGKKLAEDLEGRLVIVCRNCKQTIVIVRTAKPLAAPVLT